MLVVCNFYKTEVVWDSGMDLKGFETLLGNYSEQKIEESKISLKPKSLIKGHNLKKDLLNKL